jgi:hypothetical protein
MSVKDQLQNVDTDAVKQVSKQLAKKLAVNIVLGVVTAVTVTLISGAIVNAIQPTETAE